MESPSILSALVGSFHSRDIYRGVAKEWRGKAFLYLFVLVAISCIVLVISMYVALANLQTDWASEIIQQIPPITITDGKVSTEVEQPYTITEPETGTPIAIIDTTGTVTSLESTEAKVLITQTHVIMYKNETTTETHDLSGVANFSIDAPTIERWIAWGAAWGPIILFPFMLVGIFVYRIVLVLLYAAIGLVLNSIAGTSLQYPALLSLSAVAVTPAFALGEVLGMFGVELPNGWVIYFVLTIICLHLAIKATVNRPGDELAPAVDPIQPPADQTGGPANEPDPRDIFMS